jgi:predicted 2-oxoglutarate/Fe(II)-dependent dioxygenase YbiX
VDPTSLILERIILTAEQCQDIISSINTRSHIASRIGTHFENGDYKDIIDRNRRLSFDGTSKNPELILNPLEGFLDTLEEFYNVKVETWEKPLIRIYPVGGLFEVHSDGIGMRKNKTFYKWKDRDYSLILFLSDDFDGGELFFPNLGYTVKPEAGKMVCFPADKSEFDHGVNPVTRGTRIQIISFLTCVGTTREHNEALQGKKNPFFKRT